MSYRTPGERAQPSSTYRVTWWARLRVRIWRAFFLSNAEMRRRTLQRIEARAAVVSGAIDLVDAHRAALVAVRDDLRDHHDYDSAALAKIRERLDAITRTSGGGPG